MTETTETTTITNLVVLSQLDFDAAVRGEPTLARRYLAGLQSLLDRADLWYRLGSIRRRQEIHDDYDLVVEVEAGEPLPFDPEPVPDAYPSYDDDGRRANARFTIALHRTGGRNITRQPLYWRPEGLLTVKSRYGDEVTTFALAGDSVRQLTDRLVLHVAFDAMEAEWRNGAAEYDRRVNQPRCYASASTELTARVVECVQEWLDGGGGVAPQYMAKTVAWIADPVRVDSLDLRAIEAQLGAYLHRPELQRLLEILRQPLSTWRGGSGEAAR